MIDRIIAAATAGALALSPVAASAQTVAAPAAESVTGDNALVGDGDAARTIGIAFFLTAFVLAIFADELFGDDDDEDLDPGIPVSP